MDDIAQISGIKNHHLYYFLQIDLASQLLEINIENTSSPGNIPLTVELNNQVNEPNKANPINPANSPAITPWTKNGPLINQFEAPTSLCILISSLKL